MKVCPESQFCGHVSHVYIILPNIFPNLAKKTVDLYYGYTKIVTEVGVKE